MAKCEICGSKGAERDEDGNLYCKDCSEASDIEREKEERRRKEEDDKSNVRER